MIRCLPGWALAVTAALAGGCQHDIATPFPPGLEPFEDNPLPAQAAPYAETLATATDDSGYIHAYALGYVKAPLAAVWAAAQDSAPNVARNARTSRKPAARCGAITSVFSIRKSANALAAASLILFSAGSNRSPSLPANLATPVRVTSIPANSEVSFSGASITEDKRGKDRTAGPFIWVIPISWERCWLRPSEASSLYERPSTGS